MDIQLEASAIKLKRSLSDPKSILKNIGTSLVSDIQSSFKGQSLGSITWEHRYPNQGEPFVNYAGALSDLSNSSKVKERRFQRRPVLSDTGGLRNSITWNYGYGLLPTINVGSDLPYARINQEGLTSEQPITPTVISNLNRYLRRVRGDARRFKDRAVILSRQVSSPFGAAVKKILTENAKVGGNPLSRKTAAEKLNFFRKLSVLTTRHVERPFIGITDEALDKIVRHISVAFSGGRGVRVVIRIN